MTHDRIVDAHVHVWTSDVEKYPLAPGFEESDLWLPSFTPDEYFEHSRSVGNVRLNLVQMTWYGLDHSYILDLIASDKETFVGTGIVPGLSDVSLPRPDKAMVTLSRGGIYAFRIPMSHPHKDYPAAIALIRDHADFLSTSDKEQILRKTAEDFFFMR